MIKKQVMYKNEDVDVVRPKQYVILEIYILMLLIFQKKSCDLARFGINGQFAVLIYFTYHSSKPVF